MVRRGKKVIIPKTISYEQFLSLAKVRVKVYRNKIEPQYFIAEITDAWLAKDGFHLRVEGVGIFPGAAIRDLLDKIQGKRIWINIEDPKQARYFHVPECVTYEVAPIVDNLMYKEPKPYHGVTDQDGSLKHVIDIKDLASVSIMRVFDQWKKSIENRPITPFQITEELIVDLEANTDISAEDAEMLRQHIGQAFSLNISHSK